MGIVLSPEILVTENIKVLPIQDALNEAKCDFECSCLFLKG